MLSLLKKKSDAAAAPTAPAWHPNFRNYEKLPDIKVVRTAFFINGIAIFAALSLAIYFGFQEWKLRVINQQIAQTEALITRDKKVSDQAVALYKKFQAEVARIEEVDTFVKSKPLVSELILRIGSTLPPNIAMDSLDLRDTGLTMRVSVRGQPHVASGEANAYFEWLRGDAALKALFEEVSYTGTPAVNPATGHFTVEFHFKAKPAGGKKS